MTSLNLTAKTLNSPIGLGEVASWMLAPGNPAFREQVALLYRAFAIREDLAGGKIVETASLLAAFDIAITAPSPAGLADEFERLYKLGYAAGMVLHNGVLRIKRGEPQPLGRAMEEVRSAVYGRKNSNSKHVNTAIWGAYRPVAHYWAAYIARDANDDDGGVGTDNFPCPVADLPTFLAQADAFRHLGETTTPPHRREPILGLGEAVVVPSGVLSLLPDGKLTTTVPK